jgi:hypothetical protein
MTDFFEPIKKSLQGSMDNIEQELADSMEQNKQAFLDIFGVENIDDMFKNQQEYNPPPLFFVDTESKK